MTLLRLPALLALLLLTLAAAVARAAAPEALRSVEGITEYRLPNGLQVLLVPDDSKPSTTVNLTLRVGSRHENYGETGMAHLLEHMVFKGTPTTRNAWAEFTKRGLRANGTTWVDRTNYFASFAANDAHLQWYLGWLADAMVNSFIAKRDLDTEMTVVRNEMEMGENEPGRILFERTLAAMYQWHNYGKSTIGARTDVEGVDVARLRAFYKLYYQPDNATLVVSGRFEPQRTLAWVQQSFGKLPRPKRTLPALYTLDPVQDGERQLTLRRVGGSPMAMAGWHMPPAAHPDHAAAELLALVMGDAPGGRLHRQVVEPGRAAGSFGEVLGLADPGVLLLGLQFSPGQAAEAGAPLLAQVAESATTQPITEAEFRRAQAKWLKAWEQQFSDPERVGVALSESVAQGDWRLFFLLRDRVRDSTLADVQRVATQYLLPANRTLALYLPTDKPQRAPAPQRADVAEQLKAFKPQPPAPPVPPFDASPANLDARTLLRTLPGGARLALLPKPTRGQAVRIELELHYGDLASLQGQAEVAGLVAAMLDKGATGLDRQQIRDQLDQLKAELSFSASPGTLNVDLLTRREHAAAAIALVGRLLRTPTFPAPVLEELRRQALAALQAQRDDPEALVDRALARRGNPHPAGDPRHVATLDQAEADLKALTVAQLQEHHRRFYGASHLFLSAVGDFDPEALAQAVQAALGDWKSPMPYTRVPQPLWPRTPGREALRTPDKQNASLGLRLALPLSDRDVDYPAFYLANFILGSGGDSRLWKRLREKEGLSYSVWSWVDWSRHEPHSVWQAGAIFAPANRDKVEQAMREEIERALRDGFTAAEVQAGRQALLAARRLSRAQDGNLAAQLVGNLELGRRFAVSQQVDDAIAAATPEQVNAALRKYLRAEAIASVVAGDFKQP